MGGCSYCWILSAGQGGRGKRYQPHPSLTFQASSGNTCSPNITRGVQARDPRRCNQEGMNLEWHKLGQRWEGGGVIWGGRERRIASAHTNTTLDRHCSTHFVCTRWILSSQKHLRVELSLPLTYWEKTEVKLSQAKFSCPAKFGIKYWTRSHNTRFFNYHSNTYKEPAYAHALLIWPKVSHSTGARAAVFKCMLNAENERKRAE